MCVFLSHVLSTIPFLSIPYPLLLKSSYGVWASAVTSPVVYAHLAEKCILISGVATGGGGGQFPPTLFRPDFQIRANPVRNLKRVGVIISGVSQA